VRNSRRRISRISREKEICCYFSVASAVFDELICVVLPFSLSVSLLLFIGNECAEGGEKRGGSGGGGGGRRVKDEEKEERRMKGKKETEREKEREKRDGNNK